MDFLSKDDKVVISSKEISGEVDFHRPTGGGKFKYYSEELKMSGEANLDDIVEVNGHRRPKPVYYQPRWTQEELDEAEFNSNFVYREYRNAKEDYPDHVIDEFRGGEIEDPEFIDDLDDRTPTFAVDLPQGHTEEWTNVYTTHHKPDAIVYAQYYYGADENGMVTLISQY
jgi:hypothetical protein